MTSDRSVSACLETWEQIRWGPRTCDNSSVSREAEDCGQPVPGDGAPSNTLDTKAQVSLPDCHTWLPGSGSTVRSSADTWNSK